jgi:hypothetical protein
MRALFLAGIVAAAVLALGVAAPASAFQGDESCIDGVFEPHDATWSCTVKLSVDPFTFVDDGTQDGSLVPCIGEPYQVTIGADVTVHLLAQPDGTIREQEVALVDGSGVGLVTGHTIRFQTVATSQQTLPASGGQTLHIDEHFRLIGGGTDGNVLLDLNARDMLDPNGFTTFQFLKGRLVCAVPGPGA